MCCQCYKCDRFSYDHIVTVVFTQLTCRGDFQVNRKLVKQTVMTSVYGVTYVGAREQIKRRLEEKGCFTDDRLLFSTACYAAKVSFKGFGSL